MQVRSDPETDGDPYDDEEMMLFTIGFVCLPFGFRIFPEPSQSLPCWIA